MVSVMCLENRSHLGMLSLAGPWMTRMRKNPEDVLTKKSPIFPFKRLGFSIVVAVIPWLVRIIRHIPEPVLVRIGGRWAGIRLNPICCIASLVR